ncbi:MAG TPA: SAM-dependent methyltransferase [Solirubrobacterales bacterium]|jgi:SAM-dependent methyltransferase|nr:SAM-dependent methyltransferase [Solirubrobacterales bacterium]
MSARGSHDRAPVEHFERLARGSEDPWDYATSEYEQGKYRQTLDYLPKRTGRTLELGCSVGVFTAMLAPRCERLVAVDFSPTALERARERLRGAENVELLCRRLPEEMPDGPFDTIVCAEVLYYWSADLVREGLRRIEAALAPGGTLLAVHWRQADPRRELTGDDVHAILDEETALALDASRTTPDYLLDRWRANE